MSLYNGNRVNKNGSKKGNSIIRLKIFYIVHMIAHTDQTRTPLSTRKGEMRDISIAELGLEKAAKIETA